MDIDVSVCIVTFHSRDLLRDCLGSLAANTRVSYEVIVVDNHSRDGTEAMLRNEFPAVQFIETRGNEGYTAPMNLAMRAGRGRYLLQLNPDTLVLPEAVDRMVAYLDAHPRAGICGPKVLNRDRSMQKSCRRGEPTPWAVISYFTGLARLFPRRRLFTGYQLTHLDENQIYPVDGVSGSCMLVRRETAEALDFLDESFFAYQEDADLCRRTRDRGWQVIYYPEARIVHFGGEGGSHIQPYRSILEWHRSYYRYYRKHLARNYFFLLNWAFYLAMALKLLVALARNFARSTGKPRRRTVFQSSHP